MNIFLNNKMRDRVAKTVSVLTGVATVLSVSGFLYLAPEIAGAVAPSDYGLKEGDTISAAGSSDPDVYIVNDWGYKRLFLNPQIFNLYGHLGGFAKVKNVSAATRDAFVTSGLFRVDGDQKVYGIETTGEDVASLHWVNTTGAQAVADDPNFFKKVFIINAAEKALYNVGSEYTSVSQVPAYARGGSVATTPTPAAGAISASLASGNPAAATVTKNANGVEFLRVNLSGTGTVTQATFKRLGAGAVGDFSNVYVYDGARRLTSGKTFSSATGEVTFINLDVSVSGTKTLSFVGDLAGTAGNVDYVQLISMTLSSGTVSGLPLSGNNITMAGSSGGRIDVAKVGSIANPNLGQKGALVSEFKLTANTEAASVRRITMLQGGTEKPGDSANWKLKTGSTTWDGTINSAGYVVFDMSASPLSIAKGGEAVMYVYADVGGKANETIILYFESATDVLAIGDQYGFGMSAASGTANQGIDAFDTTGEAHTVTLQGGVLTIAYNGPSAGNVGTNTSDTVLLRFSMTAATNIEVRKTEITLCKDTGANGTFNAAADTTNGWDDITDIKVTDEATGTTILGPADGSAFTVSDSGTCADSVTGAQKSLNDVFDLAAGKTYNFKVTGDINTANSGSGVSLTAGDAVQVFLDNYTDDTPDVTVMKYSGTNTAVADADIVPQADIGGGVQTLQASSLTLGLSSSVTSQTFVRGAKDKTAVGLAFQAGNASALTVTDVVLTGYYRDATTGAFTLGCVSTECVAGLVSQVSIYEVESGTVLSSSAASNQLSNTTGTVTFNGLNWAIPAGATKTLGVKVTLGSNALADTDYISFDINTTTDVTALDSSSKTVNAGNSDPNVNTTPTVLVTVTNAGTMTTAVSPATASKHAAYWGQTGDAIGTWRFNASNEGFNIEKLNFQEDDAAVQQPLVTKNVKTVYLKYKNAAGDTITKSSTFNSVASVAFGFTGTDRPYVPKDGSLDVQMLADFKTKSEGATISSQSASLFDISFIGQSGTGDNTFRAVGEGSGTILNGSDTGITDRDQSSATQVRVYRAFPEISLVPSTVTKLSTADPVLTFTVTAKGLPDSKLFFDNQAAASGSIRFEVVASGVGTTGSPAFTVRDASDSSIVDTGTITNATAVSPHASMTINFGSDGTGKDIEIQGGASKTFKVFLDSITNFNTPLNTSAGVGADYFQLVLNDENDATDSLISWVADSAGATTDNDTTWDGTTGFANGYFRNLPVAGYQFTAQ